MGSDNINFKSNNFKCISQIKFKFLFDRSFNQVEMFIGT